MQVQVEEVQQPKEEVEEMRCIAPAEAEGIVKPKEEFDVEEIYTFGVGDQNQLEFLNLEQKDALKNVLEDWDHRHGFEFFQHGRFFSSLCHRGRHHRDFRDGHGYSFSNNCRSVERWRFSRPGR